MLLATVTLVGAGAAPARAAMLEPTAPPSLSGSFREGGTVSANPGTWPGTESIYRFQWQRCDADGGRCTTITGRTQQGYVPVAADVNGTLRVMVTATNAEGSGQATSAASPVVTGTPPANTAAPAIVGYPRTGQTLTAEPRTWSGTAPIVFAYRWISCDASGDACVQLSGATAQTYALTSTNLGRRLQVRITATNPSGQTVIYSPLTPVIGVPQPPVSTAPPVLSGAARDAETLAAGRGTWSGADPVTYTYRWLRCSELDPDACAPIAAQVAQTYKLTTADLGSVIRTDVTATNPDGAATARSAPSAVVAPAPPTTTTMPTILGQPREGQVLTGTRNPWKGTEPIAYAYEWRRCRDTACEPISGAQATTYRLQAADVGAQVGFTVVATNAAGTASKSSVLTRLVSAAAPPVSVEAPVVAGVARDGQSLTSTSGRWGGLPARYAYQWLRCEPGAPCRPIPTATRSGYKLTPDDIGATVRLQVTATNEDGTAQADSAPLGPVQAIPPASAPAVLAGTAVEGSLLTVTTGAWSGSPPIAHAYAWQRCAPDGTGCRSVPDTDRPAYALTTADIGSRVRVRITGTNAGGSDRVDSGLSGVVAGAPPTVLDPGPAITGIPRDGETLTGNRGVWRGTAPLTLTRQWQRCTSTGGGCVSIPGATAATYEATAADHGATLRLRVEATNPYGTRSATSAATPVIGAAPPESVARPTVTGKRTDGETLTGHPGTWTGTAPVAFAYRWERADALTGAWQAIPGATSATYALSATDVGTSLRLHVTATNAAARPATATSAVVTDIAALPPSVLAAPAVTGTARDGSILTADPGRWAGSEPLTRRVRWMRCDAQGSDCALVEGATATEHRLTGADIGHTLLVSVATTNAATATTGPVYARSERTAVVVPDPPGNRVAPTVLGTPRTGRTLTVERGEWTGTPSIAYAYRWHRCTVEAPVRCAPIDGATGAEYVLRSADAGATIRAEVIASNAGGTGTAMSASTAVVATSPPVNAELPVVTGAAFDDTALEGTPGRWTGIVPFTYDYRWHRCDRQGANCGLVPGASGSTYRTSAADLGYRIRLEVVARNAGGSASAFAAPTAVVGPRPPHFTTIPAITGRAAVGRRLTGTDGTWAGTPPFTVKRTWLRCEADPAGACEPIPGAAAASYQLTPADLGHRVRFRVHVDNAGVGTGTAARSLATPVVRDDPPVSVSAPVVSAEGGAKVALGVPLTATPGTWKGGPPMVPVFRWLRCDDADACAEIPGATAARYVPVLADLGARLRVTVSMDNGVGAATARSAPTAPVLGSPPVSTAAPAVTARGPLRPGSELSATTGTWTGAAPITHTYAWLRCLPAGGSCAPIPGATAAKRVLTDADVGRVLKVRVTAANAAAAVPADSAPTGRVEPLPPALRGVVAVSVEGGGRPRPGARLVADAGDWAGTAPVALTRQWQRCAAAAPCEDVAGATGPDYALGEADVGLRVRVVVTASNAAGTATAASLPTEAVWPSPPTNVERPVVTGTPHDGELLQGTTGRWTGTQPFTYEHRWYRCDRLGASCELIAGAGEAAYRVGEADMGRRIRLEVVARNGGGSTSAFAVATAAATARPPRFLTAPAVTGRHGAGQLLTGTDGTWSGTAPFTVTREWLRCDPETRACVAIDRATRPTYRLTRADVGSRIRLRVLVGNPAAGPGTLNRSSATAIIRDDPPVNVARPGVTADGPVAVGVVLTASPGRWDGGPPQDPAYQWRRCDAAEICTDIAGATSKRYVPVADDLGARLQVAVTMDNGVGASTARSTPTSAVRGAPPASTAPPVVSVRGPLRPGAQLTATAGTWTGAPPLSYDYAWLRCAPDGGDCVRVDGGSELEHVLSDADVGRVLKLRVSATNGTSTVSADSAATAEVAPLAPALAGEVTVAVAGGVRPRPGVRLVGDIGRWAGTAPVELSARWQTCVSSTVCEDLPGATGPEYELREEDVGRRLRLAVAATNAAGTVTAESQLSEEIAGSPPVARGGPAVRLAAGSVLADGGRLEAEPGDWGGTAPIKLAYEWRRCAADGGECKPIPRATAAGYSLAADDIGRRIVVRVMATSAAGRAEAVSAPTEPVAGVAPVAPGPPAIDRPAALKAGSRLTARSAPWTGTKPLALSYRWVRCDAGGEACQPLEPAATSPTLPLSARDFGRDGALLGTLRAEVTGRNPAGAATVRSAPVSQGPVPTTAKPGAKKPAPAKPKLPPPPVKRPSAKFDRRGRLVVRLACRAGEARCAGRLVAAARPLRRHISFSLRPGQAKRWRLKLSRRERRAVRKIRRVKVKLTVTAPGASPLKRTVRLKSPRRR